MVSTNVLDITGAVERMGDMEIYLEIARYFAGHVGESAVACNSALEAGNMQEAMRLAHSLKSNCATVGAEKARALCAALEAVCRSEDKNQGLALWQVVLPALVEVKEAIEAL